MKKQKQKSFILEKGNTSWIFKLENFKIPHDVIVFIDNLDNLKEGDRIKITFLKREK